MNVDWLRTAAEESPDVPALITEDRSISYRDLDRAANGVAGVVTAAGMAGGAVALWGENTPQTVAALFGIPRAAATAVVLPLGLPAVEAMRLTKAAGAKGLWGSGDGPDFERLVRARSANRPSEASGLPDPAARVVLFTSGTMQGRRGVVLTGRQIAASVEASRRRLGSGSHDHWLCVLPLGHVGGLSILWRQVAVAATTVLHQSFDREAVRRALVADVSIASLVPTMLRRILDGDGFEPTDLRAVLVGGGPADAVLLARARDRAIPALQTYGMTETSSQVCTEDPFDLGTTGTSGRPLDGVEVRTVDRDGVPRPEGMIEVRGEVVMDGYLDGPRRGDEWFRTGDIGRLDDSGRLVVFGRADRVIITGGENVHPAAVETALLGVTGVQAARVAAESDPDWGSRVVARVVVDEGVTAADVTAGVRTMLAPHEVPKRVDIVGDIGGTWKDG